jgi:hypothetical protein
VIWANRDHRAAVQLRPLRHAPFAARSCKLRLGFQSTLHAVTNRLNVRHFMIDKTTRDTTRSAYAWRCVVTGVTTGALLAAHVALVWSISGTPVAVAGDISPKSTQDAGSSDCEERLRGLVSDLDVLLDSRPASIDPFYALIRRYFPLKSCDLDAAVAVCSKSKYFLPTHQTWRQYSFGFSSGVQGYSGYRVTFTLLRASGDSELVSFKGNKQQN